MRQLQLEIDPTPNTFGGGAPCNGFQQLTTRLNDNADVLQYQGIMFTITTKDSPIEITTLSIQLQRPRATGYIFNDLDIEVYTAPGNFMDKVDDPSQWELVANTDMIELHDYSAPGFDSGVFAMMMIPATQFKTVQMENHDRRSFYVSIDGGRWISNTVDALDKVGENAVSSAHLNIQTGAGLLAPYFPEAGVDSTTSPKFAGIVHYKTTGDCRAEFTNTKVQLHMMVNVPVTLSLARTDPNAKEDPLNLDLLDALSNAVDQVINAQFNDPQANQFRQYQQDYGFAKLAAPEVRLSDFPAACPDGWDPCPTLIIDVPFTHNMELSTGAVQYQVYALVDDMIRSALETVDKTMIPQIDKEIFNLLYIGYRGVSTTFDVTLKNVPTREMNDAQLTYWERMTQFYLQKALDEVNGKDGSALALAVETESQTVIPVRNRQRRALRTTDDNRWSPRQFFERGLQFSPIGSPTTPPAPPEPTQPPTPPAPTEITYGNLQLRGRIHGGQLSYKPDMTFVEQLQTALRTNQPAYLTEIKLGLAQPSELTTSFLPDYMYFATLSQLDSNVQLYLPEGASPYEGRQQILRAPKTEAPTVAPSGPENAGSSGLNLDPKLFIYIGVAVGALAVVAVAVGLYWFCCCRNRKKDGKAYDDESYSSYTEHTPPKQSRGYYPDDPHMLPPPLTQTTSGYSSDERSSVLSAMDDHEFQRQPPRRHKSFDDADRMIPVNTRSRPRGRSYDESDAYYDEEGYRRRAPQRHRSFDDGPRDRRAPPRARSFDGGPVVAREQPLSANKPVCREQPLNAKSGSKQGSLLGALAIQPTRRPPERHFSSDDIPSMLDELPLRERGVLRSKSHDGASFQHDEEPELCPPKPLDQNVRRARSDAKRKVESSPVGRTPSEAASSDGGTDQTDESDNVSIGSIVQNPYLTRKKSNPEEKAKKKTDMATSKDADTALEKKAPVATLPESHSGSLVGSLSQAYRHFAANKRREAENPAGPDAPESRVVSRSKSYDGGSLSNSDHGQDPRPPQRTKSFESDPLRRSSDHGHYKRRDQARAYMSDRRLTEQDADMRDAPDRRGMSRTKSYDGDRAYDNSRDMDRRYREEDDIRRSGRGPPPRSRSFDESDPRLRNDDREFRGSRRDGSIREPGRGQYPPPPRRSDDLGGGSDHSRGRYPPPAQPRRSDDLSRGSDHSKGRYPPPPRRSDDLSKGSDHSRGRYPPPRQRSDDLGRGSDHSRNSRYGPRDDRFDDRGPERRAPPSRSRSDDGMLMSR